MCIYVKYTKKTFRLYDINAPNTFNDIYHLKELKVARHTSNLERLSQKFLRKKGEKNEAIATKDPVHFSFSHISEVEFKVRHHTRRVPIDSLILLRHYTQQFMKPEEY